MLILLLAAQAAAPDIQLDLRIQARDVRIERKGEAKLEMSASPEGGSDVRVSSPPSGGRNRLRNVEIRVQGEARIATEPARQDQETPPPQ